VEKSDGFIKSQARAKLKKDQLSLNMLKDLESRGLLEDLEITYHSDFSLDECFTGAQLAERLGITRQALYNRMLRGATPTTQIYVFYQGNKINNITAYTRSWA
jgi:predicted DNA-binding protein YlxM (UPF0122 family)